MYIQPTNIIQLIFVAQISFGVILIWKNTRYRGLCYLLLFAVITMSLNLLEELTRIKSTYLITPALLLIKGPILYWFVYNLIYPNKHFRNNYFIHFVPFIIGFTLTKWPQYVIGLGTISQLIYTLLSLKLINKYHLTAASIRSDANRLKIGWLTTVVVMFLSIEALDLLRLNLQPLLNININLAGQFIENTFILLLSIFLIYKAVQNPELFDEMEKYENIATSSLQAKDTEIYKAIFETVHQHIINKSLHHKPRLSLSDIASETGLTTRDISRAINHTTSKNFCDFINSLRVEDFKDRVLNSSNEKLSILNEAYNVGFNSKSSFNLIFKKETGLTPTQFLKRQK